MLIEIASEYHFLSVKIFYIEKENYKIFMLFLYKNVANLMHSCK